MFKKILQVLEIIGLTILASLPLGVAVVLKERGVADTPVLLVSLVLFGLTISLFLFIAYRRGLLSTKVSQWFSSQNLLLTGFAYVVMLLLNILGSYLITLSGQETTVNQELIEAISQKLPKLVMFLGVVVMAPLSEEILFRGLMVRLFGHKFQKVGYIVGAVIFALMHGPTDIGSWVIYLGMGSVLALVCYKTKHLEYSVLLHALHNGIGFLAFLFT